MLWRLSIVLLLVFLTSQIEAVGLLAAGWLDLTPGWGAIIILANRELDSGY